MALFKLSMGFVVSSVFAGQPVMPSCRGRGGYERQTEIVTTGLLARHGAEGRRDGQVADRLDRVAVGIDHERAVVARVVLLA